MDFNGISESFIQVYYNAYNTIAGPEGYPRQQLGSIYTPSTLMTLQDKQIVGNNDIIESICGEQLASHRKIPSHFLAQPSLNGTILLSVQGESFFEGEEFRNPFIEIFLIGQSNESFFIVNQIFSLHGI